MEDTLEDAIETYNVGDKPGFRKRDFIPVIGLATHHYRILNFRLIQKLSDLPKESLFLFYHTNAIVILYQVGQSLYEKL